MTPNAAAAIHFYDFEPTASDFLGEVVSGLRVDSSNSHPSAKLLTNLHRLPLLDAYSPTSRRRRR